MDFLKSFGFKNVTERIMNKKWKKSLNRRENKKPETDQRPEPDPEPELPSSSESKLTSSIFYKFQVGIVYATGVLDIVSCKT